LEILFIQFFVINERRTKADSTLVD